MAQFQHPKRIIMWALTYNCNASCEYCYLRDYVQPYNQLKKNDCFRVAENIVKNKNWKPQAIWLTGGEPTILSFLPELIKYFQRNGIPCVVNTNGLITGAPLNDLLNSNPKGLIVSIDSNSHHPEKFKRSFSYEYLREQIKYIAAQKNDSTILGTATVITRDTVSGLYEYAKDMQEIGVDYISLNPMHGEENDDPDGIANCLEKQLADIKHNLRIKIPSDFYLDIVLNLYKNNNDYEILCPSLRDYFFISPWGYVYPCSNEGWQKYNCLEFDMLKLKDWYIEVQRIINAIGWKRNSKSSCYSNRCVGCFKLYYDTIFTEDSY